MTDYWKPYESAERLNVPKNLVKLISQYAYSDSIFMKTEFYAFENGKIELINTRNLLGTILSFLIVLPIFAMFSLFRILFFCVFYNKEEIQSAKTEMSKMFAEVWNYKRSGKFVSMPSGLTKTDYDKLLSEFEKNL